jgi:hypothetical protein
MPACSRRVIRLRIEEDRERRCLREAVPGLRLSQELWKGDGNAESNDRSKRTPSDLGSQ